MSLEGYEQLKLENQLCFPLYAAAKEVVRKYKPVLDKLDLTYTQYITMMVLWEKEELNVKELGSLFYLDSGTLTPLLKKLEAKGYITRTRCKEDERNLIIQITEKGDALKEQAAQVKNARQMLLQSLGREPTIGEISDITGILPEEIATAEAAVANVESIQQENGDGGLSLEDVLTNQDGEEKMLEHLLLRQSLERIPQREQMLISLRYFHGLTQEQTAKIMQVSQVQVSRIEKKAIGHLRELMR